MSRVSSVNKLTNAINSAYTTKLQTDVADEAKVERETMAAFATNPNTTRAEFEAATEEGMLTRNALESARNARSGIEANNFVQQINQFSIENPDVTTQGYKDQVKSTLTGMNIQPEIYDKVVNKVTEFMPKLEAGHRNRHNKYVAKESVNTYGKEIASEAQTTAQMVRNGDMSADERKARLSTVITKDLSALVTPEERGGALATASIAGLKVGDAGIHSAVDWSTIEMDNNTRARLTDEFDAYTEAKRITDYAAQIDATGVYNPTRGTGKQPSTAVVLDANYIQAEKQANMVAIKKADQLGLKGADKEKYVTEETLKVFKNQSRGFVSPTLKRGADELIRGLYGMDTDAITDAQYQNMNALHARYKVAPTKTLGMLPDGDAGKFAKLVLRDISNNVGATSQDAIVAAVTRANAQMQRDDSTKQAELGGPFTVKETIERYDDVRWAWEKPLSRDSAIALTAQLNAVIDNDEAIDLEDAFESHIDAFIGNTMDYGDQGIMFEEPISNKFGTNSEDKAKAGIEHIGDTIAKKYEIDGDVPDIQFHYNPTNGTAVYIPEVGGQPQYHLAEQYSKLEFEKAVTTRIEMVAQAEADTENAKSGIRAAGFMGGKLSDFVDYGTGKNNKRAFNPPSTQTPNNKSRKELKADMDKVFDNITAVAFGELTANMDDGVPNNLTAMTEQYILDHNITTGEAEDIYVTAQEGEADQLASDEGIGRNAAGEAVSYSDSGVVSAGRGHQLTGSEVTQFPVGTVVSDEQIEAWWTEDMPKYREELKTFVQKNDLENVDPEALKVLFNMTYNLGAQGDTAGLNAFKGMITALQNADYPLAADEMQYSDATTKATETPWYVEVGRRAERLVARIRAIN